MINGNEIMKLIGINHQQLSYLIHIDILIPAEKRNSPRSDLFNEEDVRMLTKNKKTFRNNLLALEIEKEWNVTKKKDRVKVSAINAKGNLM
jgi:hypothetical protein